MFSMIQLNSISKIFKSELIGQAFTALDNVSFNIPEGSMVGFLGANGAGKTTSLKIIMDFIRPSSGEVVFSPALGKDRKEVFKNIGYLPERPYFYQNLTGNEFLHFMGDLSELKKTEIKSQISYWAPRFRIEHALSRELKTYSKGMLQRIGFLAAILHQPKIIILDEPLSGLDPIGRKELKDVIVEVHKAGKTVFFSTHIVPDIEEICDRVVFLKDGKLAFDGSVSSLMDSNTEQEYLFKIKLNSKSEFQTPFTKKLDLPDNLTTFSVKNEFKDKFLQEVMAKNGNLIGLEPVRVNLEEIFYKTRN
jgi:ABC-2 type transport system ATP-binding protein